MKFRWARVGTLEEKGRITDLAEMLCDPDLARRKRLRAHIHHTLAKYDHPAATAALIQALQNDPNLNNRIVVAALLANRPEQPNVESTLIEALADTQSDYRIRMHAAKGLASQSSESAATALVAALRDPDSGVRWSAADSLGFVGISQPQVIGPLTDALDDRSLRVRLWASRSLSRMGATSALPAMRRARDRSWPPWRSAMTGHIKSLEDGFV